MSLNPLALRRAYCLPSSLDSKAEERKYVSNVLKANSSTKTENVFVRDKLEQKNCPGQLADVWLSQNFPAF